MLTEPPTPLLTKMVPDDVPFATIVDSILVDTGFADQRAAKMDIDDLLRCASPSPFSSFLLSLSLLLPPSVLYEESGCCGN